MGESNTILHTSDAPVLAAREGDRLTVTINRPESRNALSRAVFAALARIFTDARTDDTLAFAVISGAGDRAFAAGGDLKELDSLRDEADVSAFSRECRAALETIRSFPAPVIAALNGPALGGGAELALACDFRVAAHTAGIGFLQGKLSLTTAWGGGIDLMRLLGPTRAMELLLSSRIVPAPEALALGLIDAAAAEGESLNAALTRFLDRFAHQTPRTARGCKALAAAYRRGAGQAELEAVETAHYTRTWMHDDHWAAADAAKARLGAGGKGGAR
ncbi:MAG: enoyl-CoA hydratase/isomerase family protein [Alphaproteobacteria bacterium]|nr:enoyl-CoA hydratase/isomerase family protein [Alphaproteobacteria bacterium]